MKLDHDTALGWVVITVSAIAAMILLGALAWRLVIALHEVDNRAECRATGKAVVTDPRTDEWRCVVPGPERP